MTVFDSIQVKGGVQGRLITVSCRSKQLGVAWNNIHGRLSGIRRELFADTEESYMENLRAKHDEVVRLLREKTEQNLLLDQSNNELLQLSNDLEELARERTIIEMSLRIADRVRNPATVIGGMARRLLDKDSLSGREKKKMNLIAAEADKIEELVKQFNAMAEQRRTIFGRENLVLLMEDALRGCPTLQRRNISVKLDVPPEPVEIHASRQVLKVALVHVLRYLTQQSAEGEELSIIVGKDSEPQVNFIGKAEPVELLKSGEGDSREIEAEPGREAGLELVRQILAEHQAEFAVESDADGRMSISIHFPRVFHEQGAIPVRLGPVRK